MSDALENAPPGASWLAIVRAHGTPEFRQHFTPDVVLKASVIEGPCLGVAEVGAFFAATSSGMYESLEFTTEVISGHKTYLEWEGTTGGRFVGGVTILTRNESGRIDAIRLFHYPLPVVRRFAEELAKRLVGRVNPGVFGSRPGN